MLGRAAGAACGCCLACDPGLLFFLQPPTRGTSGPALKLTVKNRQLWKGKEPVVPQGISQKDRLCIGSFPNRLRSVATSCIPPVKPQPLRPPARPLPTGRRGVSTLNPHLCTRVPRLLAEPGSVCTGMHANPCFQRMFRHVHRRGNLESSHAGRGYSVQYCRNGQGRRRNCLAEVCNGSEEGSYLRLSHCCITQL